MELCFTTNNQHKLDEVSALLGGIFELKTLRDIGCTAELPETSGTIPGNSRQKAEYIWTHFGLSCFADDSGLEVDALNGEPGVDSAFYSGSRDAAKNIQKLLTNLADKPMRNARFVTVFTLLLHGRNAGPRNAGPRNAGPRNAGPRNAGLRNAGPRDAGPFEHQFEGVIEGQIIAEPRGTGGFGYDPVFQPNGYDRTFAEMSIAEKGLISHRAQALAKMTAYLNELVK